MSFTEAVRVVFSKYATFAGRAQRPEYWWFALFGFLVSIVAAIVDAILGTGYLVQILVILPLVLPGIAVAVRRLHDTGRSGGWYFISFIPFVGAIVMIVFLVQKSDGDNDYGPSPTQGQATGEAAPSQP